MIVKLFSDRDFVASPSNDDNLRLFLPNYSGGFLLHGFLNTSKFDGFFIRENNFEFKTFDFLTEESLKVDSVNRFRNFALLTFNNNNSLFVFVPEQSNTIIFDFNTSSKLTFNFDIRKNFDFSDYGRVYEVKVVDFKGKKFAVVSFKKFSDNSKTTLDYTFFSVFYASSQDYQIIDKWIKKDYEFDRHRNSDNLRFVLSALSTSSRKVIVSSSTDLESCFGEIFIWLNYNSSLLLNALNNKSNGSTIKLARYYAFDSVKSLLTTKQSVLAGFPWFSVEWFRDELLSLIFLINTFRPDDLSQSMLADTKKILFGVLNFVRKKGFFSSNENSDLRSADSPGLLAICFNHLLSKNLLTGSEILYLRRHFIELVDSDIKNYYDKHINLFKSYPEETWMDSIDRSGYRIEIQALYLAALDFAYKLVDNEKYSHLSFLIVESVRNHFLLNDYLIDGLDRNLSKDLLARPNVFLAYFFFPKLLPKNKWISSFDYSLSKLWLNWGGLSTVENSNAVRSDTGENPSAYHNGDSWYFVNNIAALSMLDLDAKRYLFYVHKILIASIKDNLFLYAPGASSETSDNSSQKSCGCPVQAWSNATLFALIDSFLTYSNSIKKKP